MWRQLLLTITLLTWWLAPGVFAASLAPALTSAEMFRACKGGSAHACAQVAREVEQYDVREAQEIADEACRHGAKEACDFALRHSVTLMRAGEVGTGLAYLHGSCETGSKESCLRFKILLITLGLALGLGWAMLLSFLWVLFRRGTTQSTAAAGVFPNIKQSLLMLLALVLTTAALFVSLRVVPHSGAGESMTQAAWVTFAGWAVVLGLGFRKAGAGAGAVFALAGFQLQQASASFLLGLGASVLLSEVDNVTRAWISLPEFMAPEIFSGSLAAVVLVALIAPLTEEFFFRGLVLRGLVFHHGAKKAIVVSALLFSIAHGNPPQLVPTFLIGLLLAWVTLKTQTLVPALVIHFTNNSLVALVSKRLDISNFGTPAFTGSGHQPLWFDALGLVLFAAGLVLLSRTCRCQALAPLQLTDQRRAA